MRITTPAICGSDLHRYEGRTDAEFGIIFGHGNMGIIEEVGPGVTTRRKGDRVVLPFNVACGYCDNCRAGKTAFCLTVNAPGAGGAYGYVGMGPYSGGQVEYLRVPFADFNCVPLPVGEQHEDDFALFADFFPTGYHATELAGIRPGETVAVYVRGARRADGRLLRDAQGREPGVRGQGRRTAEAGRAHRCRAHRLHPW